MAIDSVSPVMSASPLTSISRPPETTASARESAAQENDARRVAESVRGAAPAVQGRPEESSGPSAGTRVQVIATPDAEGSLREAASQIARASASADSSAALRRASEAYQRVSSARQAMASQEQNNGATSVDVMA
jgi:hypothetical protein